MTSPTDDPRAYLAPTAFIDSDADNVVAFARRVTAGETDPVTKAIRLFYAVRDEIPYNPYDNFRALDTYRASATLARGSGFCVAKAALLAAVARAAGVPARVGFADVRNHLCTPRLREIIGGADIFYYHGYVELHLEGRWVKATPAFDRGLCDRFGVLPLEFDGRHDSLFHPYDRSGRRHMEYVNDRGVHADIPARDVVALFEREYPKLMEATSPVPATRFREEAEQAEAAGEP